MCEECKGSVEDTLAVRKRVSTLLGVKRVRLAVCAHCAEHKYGVEDAREAVRRKKFQRRFGDLIAWLDNHPDLVARHHMLRNCRRALNSGEDIHPMYVSQSSELRKRQRTYCLWEPTVLRLYEYVVGCPEDKRAKSMLSRLTNADANVHENEIMTAHIYVSAQGSQK